MTREDVWSTTAADAAIAEQMRGMAEDVDSRPTAAEIRREMDEISARTSRASSGCACRRVDCLVCGLERVLERIRKGGVA
jgi:hypothetical protein